MIRLITVIGHGTNLLPHFIQHYQQIVDEINIVVYESDKFPLLGNEISNIIDGYNNVKIVRVHKDRVFDWDKVTALYNFGKSTYPNDWWVVADIDEFHVYPNFVKSITEECDRNGWDIVRGGFIDRIGPDGEFVELEEDKWIWEQFPNAGFFRYPMSRANPNKICIMKGYVELTSGQHYAKIDGQTTWKWQGWNHPLINPHTFVQVHHFKWDKTSIERVKAVADNRQSYSFSNEYGVMYENLRKSKFKIDLNRSEYYFELGLTQPEFNRYTNWDKLIKKIMSV